MDKVTVIIPNYNGIQYLEACLQSLYQQKTEGFTWKTIVVDNGSTDMSTSLLKEKFPQAALICLSRNTGFCHAVNMGIQQSDTPYVILLNNDTVVQEGYLQSLVEAMEAHSNAFAVSAQMLMWDRTDRIDDAGDQYCALGWAFSRGKGKASHLYDKPAAVFAACGGAAIYRRSVFHQIGDFDENHFAYLEDIDICYRARIYGYKSYYEPRAKVLHAGSASSGSRYNEFKTRLASANSVYLIGKNMPLLQILWNLPFLMAGFFLKILFFFRRKMGMLYIEGLLRGFQRCFSPSGKAHKVKFQWCNLKNYIAIQGQLYLNLLRFFNKN